ncbi:SpoVR family protein [Candidatus Parvarchaeota archaeon]|nr:SpoVR family protein [Candidatus Parvarchaeota archaeon]
MEIVVKEGAKVHDGYTKAAREIADFAVDKLHLDFEDVEFRLVDNDEMSEVMALYQDPLPTWETYQNYYMQKSRGEYRYGMLYEIVSHSVIDPATNKKKIISYIRNSNKEHEVLSVIAHVYGHLHMDKNNFICKRCGRDLNMDVKRRKRYRELERILGVKTVEEVYDIGKSLASLIGIDRPKSLDEEIKESRDEYYDTEPIIPRKDEYDAFQFIIDNSEISGWQKELLQMIHDINTDIAMINVMIMHEGFATFVQEKYAIEKAKTDPAMAMKMEDFLLGIANPINEGQLRYALGFRLFKYVEECWNKGRHGILYESLPESEKKDYDNHENKGLDKVLDIVKTKTDWDFIFSYASQEFLEMYTKEVKDNIEYLKRTLSENNPNFYNIYSHLDALDKKYTYDDITKFKVNLLTGAESYTPPVFIPRGGGNYDREGGLLIKQDMSLINKYIDGYKKKEEDEENNIYSMLTLDNHRTAATLLRIYGIWKKPVYLQTIDPEDGEPMLIYTGDGEDIEYGSVPSAQDPGIN